jgi:hypothetical protein
MSSIAEPAQAGEFSRRHLLEVGPSSLVSAIAAATGVGLRKHPIDPNLLAGRKIP